MQIVEFASVLAELCGGYFEGRLTVAEYRTQRRAVLDELDLVLNGKKPVDVIAEPGSDAIQTPEPAGGDVPGDVADVPGQIGEDFNE